MQGNQDSYLAYCERQALVIWSYVAGIMLTNIVAIIQLSTLPKLGTFQIVAVYCFAVSTPVLYWCLTSLKHQATGKHPYDHFSWTGIGVGALGTGVGTCVLGFLVMHLGPSQASVPQLFAAAV